MEAMECRVCVCVCVCVIDTDNTQDVMEPSRTQTGDLVSTRVNRAFREQRTLGLL